MIEVFPVPGAPVIMILINFNSFLNYIYTKLNYSINQIMVDEEFYSRFSENLESSQQWPGPYMFKFILKEKETSREDIENIFKGMDAVFSIKKSSKNNFISISIRLIMKNPESVIQIYKIVSKFKGVLSL